MYPKKSGYIYKTTLDHNAKEKQRLMSENSKPSVTLFELTNFEQENSWNNRLFWSGD